MTTLPSAQFRKTYASLAEPATVTADGRPLGTFYPAGTEPHPAPVIAAAGLLREVPLCPDCQVRMRTYLSRQGR